MLSHAWLHVFFLGEHLEELGVVTCVEEVLRPHSVQVSSIHFQVVDKFFILGQQNLECVFGVCLICSRDLFRGSLAWGTLTREISDEVVHLRTILGDDFLRKGLHLRSV